MHRRFRTTSVLALLVVSALAAIACDGAGGPGRALASAGHATCLVHSLPSFVDQGELADAATVADVVEVECNPYIYGTGTKVTITAEQLYDRCQKHLTWYVPNTEEPDGFGVASGSSVNLRLDADGNATVALLAGPNCMPGESLIALDEDEAPYETFTASFQVLPPVKTPQGVSALPPEQVEDAGSSAVATIVEAEFPGHPEAKVRLDAEQLYDRCEQGERLIWVRENGEVLRGRPELAGEEAVQLDDNGNGFAILIGSDSCAEGTSLIEADLEESPFTTETTTFTVAAPAADRRTVVHDRKAAGNQGQRSRLHDLSADGRDRARRSTTKSSSGTRPTLPRHSARSPTRTATPARSPAGPGRARSRRGNRRPTRAITC